MRKIILAGAFVELIELCEKCGYEIIGIADTACEDKYYGYDILGDDDYIIANKESYRDCNIVMVPDKTSVRKKLYEKYKSAGFSFETIISPGANISKYAEINEGAIIHDFCNVSANAVVGKCARLNVGSNVMHDSIIGDFSIVAPNSVILGRCKIGECSYIGSNSTILPERKIGANSVIGAASVVTKDVDSQMTVAGNPAHLLK